MIRRAQLAERRTVRHDPALSLDDEVHAAERVLRIVVVERFALAFPCDIEQVAERRHFFGEEVVARYNAHGLHE